MSPTPSESNRSWFTKLIRDHRFALAIMAGVVGLTCGLASVVFHWCIAGWTYLMTGYTDYTEHPGASHGYLGVGTWFLLIVPVLSALLYGPLIQKWAPTARGHGIPEIMLAVRRKGSRIPGRIAIVKIIASAMTLGGGGSVGREGPIAQVGAAIGSKLATLTGLPSQRIILLAGVGAGAGIAATFNAPLAGAMFALEVILVKFSAETFGMAVVASVSASIVSHYFIGNTPVVALPQNLSWDSDIALAPAAAVGILAGLAGLAFSKILYALEDAVNWVYRGPEWARPAIGSVLLGLALLVFPYMYGSGYPIQVNALTGKYTIGMLAALLVARILFTSYTIAIGGSGGVFAPSLFVGAITGAIVGELISPDDPLFIGTLGVIGMAAAFAGAARAPITAVLIIVEMTGQYDLILPVMLAVVIAVGISRFLTRETIYTAKLFRRGDTLDEPVDHTLVGRHAAKELMEPVPLTLDSAESVKSALTQLHRTGESTALVTDKEGNFVGLATPLALSAAQGADEDAVIGEAQLDTSHVLSADLPSEVLSVMLNSRMSAVPVIEDGKAIGWISQRALVSRMYREQRRAIAAGKQSSWGSRWLEKHPGARKYFR
ncbi:MAG: chloride channel protein [Winkia neuii]|nr:chloride channel protein [Winkia neuii]